LLLALSAAAGCGGDDTIDGFTPEEWDMIHELSPLPDPPPDPTNRFADNADAARLGQSLFFEKRTSGPITFDATAEEGALGAVGESGKSSCAVCHAASGSFIDTRSNPGATSLGTGGWLPRNTLTLTNAIYYKWSGWPGFIDTYWGHALLGIEAGAAGNGDRLRLAHVVYEHYRDQYNALFDPDLDPALDPAAPDAARFPPSGKPKSPTGEDGPWETMTAADQEHVTNIVVKCI
jgi:cytochrome c peroxidase